MPNSTLSQSAQEVHDEIMALADKLARLNASAFYTDAMYDKDRAALSLRLKEALATNAGHEGSASVVLLEAADFWQHYSMLSEDAQRELDGDAKFDMLQRMRAAAAPQHQAGASKQIDVRAWEHEGDPTRVISAAQKAQAERDGGASASSVRPYSVPLVRVTDGVTDVQGMGGPVGAPVGGVKTGAEPQPPAGMVPNFCNAERCTCRMGFGYVACDQQPKWKSAPGVQDAPTTQPKGGL